MAAPYPSRTKTYNPLDQVASADLNSVQDGIVACSDAIVSAHSVPPAAFQPADGAEEADRGVNLAGTNYLASDKAAASGALELIAPIELQHGAPMTTLKVWGNLTAAGALVRARLYRVTMADATLTQLGSDIDLTGSTGNLNGATSFTETVDNENYAYFLYVALTNAVMTREARYLGARVK